VRRLRRQRRVACGVGTVAVMTNQKKEEVVAGDVAPLRRKGVGGNGRTPAPPLLAGLVCFVAAFVLLRKAAQEARP